MTTMFSFDPQDIMLHLKPIVLQNPLNLTLISKEVEIFEIFCNEKVYIYSFMQPACNIFLVESQKPP